MAVQINPHGLAKKKKKEQLEKQMATSGPPTAGGLRWTVS